MNLSKSMNNTLNNLNKSVDKCVNNDIVSTVFIILVIFYSILIAPTLNLNTAKIFDNVIIRILILACIVGLSLFDPIKALLLAIAFVISIQRLYKLKVKERDQVNKKNNNVIVNTPDINNALNNNMDISGEEQDINILNDVDVNNIINANNGVENKDNNVNNLNNVNNVNTTSMASNIGSLLNDNGMAGITNPRVVEPFQSSDDTSQINIVNVNTSNSPLNVANKSNQNAISAENSMTGDPFELIPQPEDNISQEELMRNNYLTNEAAEIINEVENNTLVLDNVLVNEEHPAFQTLTDNVISSSNSFTSKAQLLDAQSNIVPSCADQSHQQKTFKNQHGTQGLDHPSGALRDANLTNYSSKF